MGVTKITVGVICTSASSAAPSYRLYLDNDLLTERTFIWNRNTFVQENIIANLEQGQHQLRVESCGELGEFRLKDVTIDGAVSKSEQFLT